MVRLVNGKLKEIMDKIKDKDYGYYTSHKYSRPMFGRSVLNCSDEVVPGSNARRRKILDLMKITEYTDFIETYSRIVHEMHNILLEETMLFLDCSEHEARLWIDKYVDFNRVHLSEKEGRKYMQVDPLFKKKY